MGYQPVTLSRSNSADYGMSLGGGVMAAYSWAPYGASYPMYPGVYSPSFVKQGCPKSTEMDTGLVAKHNLDCKLFQS